MQQFADPAEAQVLALAIVEAIPDPLLVLNDAYRIVAANRGFAKAFGILPKVSHGEVLFDLAGGVWDIPALRDLLRRVFASDVPVDRFEIEGDFAPSGPCTIILGERIADRVAHFGGSWSFILLFIGFLVGWIMLNTVLMNSLGSGFDVYPFIFLNLMLSMVAALQAPIILMSQNGRQRVTGLLRRWTTKSI